MPQSHTTDQPMTPRGSVKKRNQQHHIHKTTKAKQTALSLPQRDDCKTRNVEQTRPNTTPPPPKQWERQQT